MSDKKNLFFNEPSSRENRPELVDYIKKLADKAKNLTYEQRLSGPGHVIAMDIAGALAFQGAKGVDGEDWITEELEPELFQLLQVSGSLDADENQPSEWDRLFSIVSKI